MFSTTHRTRTALRPLIACTAFAAVCLPVATASASLDSDVQALVNAKINGGQRGWLLRRINGPELAGQNKNYPFYPASSIKVVEHAHAMLEVEAFNVFLTTDIPVYEDPDESCEDNHAGHTATMRDLEDSLRRMMEQSNNQDTNAVQEYFTRADINDTMWNTIGLSPNTQLNHKFACGGPTNNPANQFPLADAALLYEKIALGQVFADDANRTKFYQLMLNGLPQAFVDILNEERPNGMTDDTYETFKNQCRIAWKGGNIGTEYQSTMGWVRLPIPTCFSAPPREYVFGVFFDEAIQIAPGFTPWSVVKELLRGEVREAMEYWANCEQCGTPEAGPCNVAHGGVGCSDGECCETVCAYDPFCCDPEFGWDQACVGHAFVLCGTAPDNNDCTYAPEIDNCDVVEFDITSATNDGPNHDAECEWDTEFIKDVWYKYYAPADGMLSISACSDPNDPFAIWLAVYRGCSYLPNQNIFMDCTFLDFDETSCNDGPGTSLTFPVIQGQCYKIRVGAANPAIGTGLLRITCLEPGDMAIAPNDLGEETGTFAFDTTGASTDGASNDSCGIGDSQTHNDIWFLWTAPSDGTATFDTCNADFDTRLEVFNASSAGGPPTDLLACSDDAPGCGSYGSRASVPVQSGQPLVIRVGGFGGASGSGELAIAAFPACPGDTNDDGIINVDDLNNVILDWGTDGSANGGDVAGPFAGDPPDGIVDVNDLNAIIIGWGVCLPV